MSKRRCTALDTWWTFCRLGSPRERTALNSISRSGMVWAHGRDHRAPWRARQAGRGPARRAQARASAGPTCLQAPTMPAKARHPRLVDVSGPLKRSASRCKPQHRQASPYPVVGPQERRLANRAGSLLGGHLTHFGETPLVTQRQFSPCGSLICWASASQAGRLHCQVRSWQL